MKVLNILIIILSFQLNYLCGENMVFRISNIGISSADSNTAFAINDNNQVVGKCTLDGANIFFIWQEEKMELIDLPTTAIPKAINSDCQICGQYTSIEGFTRGFIFNLETGFIDLGTLGGSNLWVEDMNESGQIVGYSEIAGGLIHAFIWSNDQISDLGAFKNIYGIGESRAYGINDHGDIVGCANEPSRSRGGAIYRWFDRPCIWQNGVLTRLFPGEYGGFRQKALDINNKKEIISFLQTSAYVGEATYLNWETQERVIISTRRLEPKEGVLRKINENSIMISDDSFIANLEHYEQIRLVIDPLWKQLKQVYGINKNNIIIGEAVDIYDKVHAVILLPEE